MCCLFVGAGLGRHNRDGLRFGLTVAGGLPLAPAILGVILGPIGETNLRRALMTDSDLTIFVTRPISLLFLVLALFSVIWPFFQRYRQKRQTQKKSNS